MANKYQIVVRAVLDKTNLQTDLDKLSVQINKKMSTSVGGTKGVKINLDAQHLENQIVKWENRITKMKASTPAAFTDSNAVKKSLGEVTAAMSEFEITGGKGIDNVRTAFSTLDKDVSVFKNSIRNVHHDGIKFFDEMALNIKKVIQWGLITGAVYGSIRSMQKGVQYLRDLNKEMTNIQIVTGMSKDNVGQLSSEYNKLAQDIGATTLEVAKGGLEWFRQGKTASEVVELTKASMMMSKLGNIEAAQSTEYMTSMLNGFKLEAEDSVTIVDKLVALDNAYATSVGEIASALQRSSNSAQQAGVTFDELSSYITIVSSVTRKSSESIGESFKTMFARMENIKLGNVLDDEATSISDVESALSLVDIELRETSDSFRDMGDVLTDVSDKWGTMTDIEQSAIASAVAGTRQRENFLVLMNNFNEVLVAQAIEMNSAGLAVERYELYLNGLEAATNRSKTAMEKMWQATFNQEGLIFLEDLKTNIFNAISSIGGLVPPLVGILSILAGGNWGKIAAIFPKIAANAAAASVGVKAFGASLLTLSTLGIVVAVAAIGAFIWWAGRLDRQIDKNKENIDELNSSISSYESSIQGYRDIINRVDEVSSSFNELRNKTSLSNEEQTKFINLNNELKALLPDINGLYDENGNFIVSNTVDLENLNEQKRIEIGLLRDELAIKKEQRSGSLVEQYELNTKKAKRMARFATSFEKTGRIGEGSGAEYYRAQEESFVNDAKLALNELAREYMSAQAAGEEAVRSFEEGIVESAKDGTDVLSELLAYVGEISSAYGTLGEQASEATMPNVKTPEAYAQEITSIYEQAEAVKNLIYSVDTLNGVSAAQIATLQQMFPLEYQQALIIDQQTGVISLNVQALQALIMAKASASSAAIQHAASLNQENSALQGVLSLARGVAGQVSSPSFWSPPASYGGGGGGGSTRNEAQENYNELLSYTIKMLRKEKEIQKEALEEQLDGYKKIIDAKKSILDKQKEEDEYQKDLADGNKELASIDNELLQLQFDNSEYAKKRRLELEEEKASVIEDIGKMQSDRSVEIQKDALDEDYKNFEEQIEMKIEAIQDYLAKDGAIRAEAIQLLENRNSAFYNRLLEWNRAYGTGIDNDITSKWHNASAAAANYGATAAAAMQMASLDKKSNYRISYSGHIGGEDFRVYYANRATGGLISESQYLALPSYHSGGVVGTTSNESEVLAKLLKGEVVVTRQQSAGYMNDVLPDMLSQARNEGNVSIPININIDGILNKDILPDLKNTVNEAVVQALGKRGRNRTVSSFSI